MFLSLGWLLGGLGLWLSAKHEETVGEMLPRLGFGNTPGSAIGSIATRGALRRVGLAFYFWFCSGRLASLASSTIVRRQRSLKYDSDSTSELLDWRRHCKKFPGARSRAHQMSL